MLFIYITKLPTRTSISLFFTYLYLSSHKRISLYDIMDSYSVPFLVTAFVLFNILAEDRPAGARQLGSCLVRFLVGCRAASCRAPGTPGQGRQNPGLFRHGA